MVSLHEILQLAVQLSRDEQRQLRDQLATWLNELPTPYCAAPATVRLP